MAYCVKCGAMVDDSVRICPQCGAEIPNLTGGHTGSYTGQSNYGGNGYGQNAGGQGYTYYQESGQGNYQENAAGSYFYADEVRQNKAMGVLSYLGILVLIPLLAGNRQSQYVKHHINQGLVLFILSALVDLLEGHYVWGLHSIIHFESGLLGWGLDVLNLVFFILAIMGIISACRGERKELPIIGKIKFFK